MNRRRRPLHLGVALTLLLGCSSAAEQEIAFASASAGSN